MVATSGSRIIVPTDFSDASVHALETALKFAERLGAEVELLVVVPKSEPLFPHNPENRKAAARIDQEEVERAQAALDAVAEQHGQVASTHVGHGTPYEAILECAEERGAELIVMGTTGHNFAGRMLLGSTTERVLRHGQRPVLVVPHSA